MLWQRGTGHTPEPGVALLQLGDAYHERTDEVGYQPGQERATIAAYGNIDAADEAAYMGRRKPRGPDIEGMRQFDERGDRESPDVFVGRADIIAKLTRLLRSTERSGGIRGVSRVIQGAPGAGKTSLLCELQRRWSLDKSPFARWRAPWRHGPADAGTEQAPLVLNPQPDSFSDRVSLVTEVFRAMGGTRLTLPHGSESEDHRLGVRGLGVQATRAKDSTRQVMGDRITFRTLREHFPKWKPVIVLLVDEAQQIRPDDEWEDEDGRRHLINRSVAELHRGDRGLPIIPIYFGLSNTRAHIAALGASRMGDATTSGLPPLSMNECARGARETLRGYRPIGTAVELDRWAQACAEASDGWPQHLHNNIRACCETLADAGGALRDAPLEDAVRKGAEKRRRYYDERVEAIGEHARTALAAVSQVTVNSPLERHTIVELLRKDLLEEDAVPSGHAKSAAGELFDRMVNVGVLEGVGGSPPGYACPIPSFATYLASGRVPTPAVDPDGTLGLGSRRESRGRSQ